MMCEVIDEEHDAWLAQQSFVVRLLDRWVLTPWGRAHHLAKHPEGNTMYKVRHRWQRSRPVHAAHARKTLRAAKPPHSLPIACTRRVLQHWKPRRGMVAYLALLTALLYFAAVVLHCIPAPPSAAAGSAAGAALLAGRPHTAETTWGLLQPGWWYPAAEWLRTPWVRCYLLLAVICNLCFAYCNHVTTARRTFFRGAHGGYRDVIAVNLMVPVMVWIGMVPLAEQLFPSPLGAAHAPPPPFDGSLDVASAAPVAPVEDGGHLAHGSRAGALSVDAAPDPTGSAAAAMAAVSSLAAAAVAALTNTMQRAVVTAPVVAGTDGVAAGVVASVADEKAGVQGRLLFGADVEVDTGVAPLAAAADAAFIETESRAAGDHHDRARRSQHKRHAAQPANLTWLAALSAAWSNLHARMHATLWLLFGSIASIHIPYLVRAGIFDKSISAVDVANASTGSFIGIVARVLIMLVFFIRHMFWAVDEGEVGWRGPLYLSIVGGCWLVTRLCRDRYYLHWHHWAAGFMLYPCARLESIPLTMVLQGVCIGQIVEGAARWSCAPLWHRHAWAGWGRTLI